MICDATASDHVGILLLTLAKIGMFEGQVQIGELVSCTILKIVPGYISELLELCGPQTGTDTSRKSTKSVG